MSQRTRRQFLAGAVASAGPLAAADNKRGAPPRRPNLVFVFSDQQSWDMLGCYGNSQAVTPNLDSFAGEGVRFRHCVSSSPLCTPFRGMLLSGLHPLHSGAIENDVRMLPGDGNYLGQVLGKAGYRLGYYGKWHLYGGNRVRPIPRGPDRYGFDGPFLTNNCTVVFDAARAYYWDEEGRRQLYGDWEPYAQTKQALRFLDENASEPFALFVSWHPPHNWSPVKGPAKGPEDGYGAPDDMLQLYRAESLNLRGNCQDTPSSRGVYRGHLAMCSSLDRTFGQIVAKLKEKGVLDNTIVVYTSDHGDTLLSHGFRYNKMRPEAESIRVPLMIRYPRLLAPRASDLLVGTLDLMPTLLGMMGLTVPGACHGRNLTDAIVQRRDNAVDSVPLFLLPLDWRGVYTRRHTFAFDTNRGGPNLYREMFFQTPAGVQWNCLYDRQADRWETRNLFDTPSARKLRARLEERTRAWMKQFGDRGLPNEVALEKLLPREDFEHRRARRFNQAEGKLQGKPVDLLRGV
jgi:arylsulfatase A-like enzyme